MGQANQRSEKEFALSVEKGNREDEHGGSA
jgi:hypothetical protein